MYTVFIIDDEPTTRNGLINHFNWEKLDIKVVGEADDGETALPLLEKIKPDILLTDVKMPGLDGIETVRRAMPLLPGLKTVFISGYDDAAYLRSVLKMGARDYILKPIDIAELEACMVKLTQELENERLENQNLRNMERSLRDGIPLIRAQFLADIIRGRVKDNDKGRSKLNSLGLPAGSPSFTAVILSPDDAESSPDHGFQDNLPLLNFAVTNIADETISKYFPCRIIDDPFTLWQLAVIVIPPEPQTDNAALRAVITDVRDMIKKNMRLSVSAGIGHSVNSIFEINASYDTAVEALRHRLYLGYGSVTVYDPALLSYIGGSAESSHSTGDIRALLEHGDEGGIETWMDSFLNGMIRTKNTELGFYRKEAGRILYEADAVLNRHISVNPDSGLSLKEIQERLDKTETLRQIRELAEGYFRDIHNLIKLKNDTSTKKIISKVKAMIAERFNLPLTISELARDVYLSPTYLCVLFKQETGVTINAYQTAVRMEKAKNMLDDFSNKLYDISSAVGYSNPSYFSRQFKKYTGMLPSEYRSRG